MVTRLIVAAATLAALSAPTSAQDMRLKYAVHVPQLNVVAEGNQYFADRVEQLSSGRIVIDIYWNRALGSQQEMLPLLEAGAVDFTTLETAQYGETPLMGFMNTIFPVHRDGEKLLEMSDWLYANSAGIQRELERVGARVVFLQHLPSYHLLCTRPLRTMADFQGARLRAFGAYVPVMWQGLGANAVNVVTNEMYEGLSKGVFDCTFLPAPFLHNLKLYEVAKYLIDVPFGMIEFAPTLASNMSWESLSEADREIIMQAGRDAQAWAVRNTNEKAQDAIDALVAEGVEIVAFEETDILFSAIPDLISAWEERQTAEGRGEEAREITAFAREALAGE